MASAWLYALQAVYAGTPEQVHEYGLYRVVLVVGHADVFGANVVPQLFEIVVAQVARSHLDAYFMQVCISSCVKVC